ncbi:MAG: hypothetical protein ACOCWQ_05555 [Nanoarchaeota archaeon]
MTYSAHKGHFIFLVFVIVAVISAYLYATATEQEIGAEVELDDSAKTIWYGRIQDPVVRSALLLGGAIITAVFLIVALSRQYF